jgi:uncharacterized protein DUF3800
VQNYVEVGQVKEWDEIISILEPAPEDRVAVFYRAYVDDSSDEKQEFVMVAGALMATPEQWRSVNGGWLKTLKRYGLSYFRTTEYNSLRGEFSLFRDAVKYPKPKGSQAAKELRDTLEEVIQTKVLGIACFINLREFQEVVEECKKLRRNFAPDPFNFASQTVIRECAFAAQRHLRGISNKVAFVCDDSPNSEKFAHSYLEFRRKNDPVRDTLLGMVHRDDKDTPPLQAADMVAGLTKEVSLKYVTQGSAFPTALPRLNGVLWKIVSWNKSKMLELARRQ